jgi:hypothetical protein
VVLPVRQASKVYALASGLVEAASAGLLVSRSASATCAQQSMANFDHSHVYMVIMWLQEVSLLVHVPAAADFC